MVLFHLLTNNQEVGSKTMENLYPSVMDRLFQIAQIGDVEKLQQLLEEKPLILHQAPLICAENPLHFSSAAGHLDFTREMVKLKPEFARGLNPEGYSCLHLASANGHVQIVREIISVDPVLCRVKGRGGKTPFHVAVLTGRIDLIKEMLSSCEGCIEDVTVQKETAFHLAVRNYQFESLQVMLDWIRQMKKEDILNKKDEHGNTILHLAVWKKQRQALELLLSNSAGTLEVNAINKSGLTALDLLLIFPSEAGDREIEEIIKGAGALRAQDIALHITTHSSSARGSLASQGVCNLVEYFSFHAGRDSPGEVRGTLLVLAVLVATATYQVGINPPGGVWQDDSQGQVAGTSIMGFHNMVSYVLLVAFNSIGFSMSLYMIGTLTGKFPLQTELQICLFALYCTYNLSVTVLSPKSAQLFTIVFISVLPTAVPIFCSLLRKYRFGGLARIFRRGN